MFQLVPITSPKKPGNAAGIAGHVLMTFPHHAERQIRWSLWSFLVPVLAKTKVTLFLILWLAPKGKGWLSHVSSKNPCTAVWMGFCLPWSDCRRQLAMDLCGMGLSLRAGLVFGLNREKNIPQNESEGLGLDVSPWRVQCELHPSTNRASDFASGTLCLPVSALPNRRGGLSRSSMAPSTAQKTHQKCFCSISSPWTGWVFPAQLLQVFQSGICSSRALLLHFSVLSHAHNPCSYTCPFSGIPCALPQATGLILSQLVLSQPRKTFCML